MPCVSGAGSAVKQPFQQRSVFVAHLFSSGAAVPPESILHPLPKIDVDNSVVFAVVYASLVIDLAGVNYVGQKPEEAVLGERLSAALLTLLGGPLLVFPATSFDFLNDRDQGFVLQVELVHPPDLYGFVLVDDQPAAFRVDVIPENRHPADPLALAPCGGHLVAGALRDDLPLELGKR